MLGLLATQSFLLFAYEYSTAIPMQMKIIPNIIVSPPLYEITFSRRCYKCIQISYITHTMNNMNNTGRQ